MSSSIPNSKSLPPQNILFTEALIAASGIQPEVDEPLLALQRASSRSQTTDFQKSSYNVPEIKPPEANMANLIQLLRTLQQTVTISDMANALVNAEFIQSQLDAAKVNEAANIAATSAANTDLEEKSKSQRILSWVMVGVGLLVAALGLIAVLFTGGTALAIGIAIVGAALAVLALANNIGHELKATRKNEFGEDVPLNLDIFELVNLIIEDMVAKGEIKVIGLNADVNTPGAVTRKSYEDMKSKVVLAVTIIVTVILFILSISSFFKQGAKVVSTVVDAAETAQEATINATRVNMLVSATTLISALGSLGNSAMSFVMAFDRNDLRTMQITAKQLEGVIQSLQQQFDVNIENFKLAMNFQDVLRKKIAEAMADFNEGSVTIANKIRN